MSTITERQNNLIRAMKQQNFQQFFDGDAQDAYETLTSAMESLVNYQNSVISMETQMKFLRFIKEGQDFRDAVVQLDTNRRYKHDAAIANLNILNRISEAYGVEPFCPVDRTQISSRQKKRWTKQSSVTGLQNWTKDLDISIPPAMI